ncbi:MAG TPA: glycosyltransferase family 2 protein [Rhizomicrobium sp.]|jgi:exo-beta-1,3-glucanase (GH17 family)/cellulose synthase/poly-beta-1,6-N-acetylglucosamine synthase-like glycosyltransferase
MIALWRRVVSGGTVRIAIALCLVVAGSALYWASRDYAVDAPDWGGQVQGLAYSPSHTYTDEDHDMTPSDVIEADMQRIRPTTSHIRTYTVAHGLDRVPEIARRYGITVSLGGWIGPDLDLNEKELTLLIRTALNNSNVDRVFVGNETMLRGDVSADQLNDYIKRVRAALPNRIKVSTAETWSTWLLTPEIAQNVDFITIHLLPYWEGIPAQGAIDFIPRAYAHIEEQFPDKPIVIGEAGWPSQGRTRRASEASLANEAFFTRSFVQLALDKGYDYYLMEAFDQPWKSDNEGAVGAYWGMFRADGTPKFGLTGVLRSFPEWRFYALLAAIGSFLLGLLILGRMPRVHAPGYLVMGGLVGLVATGLLMLLDTTTVEYLQPSDLAMTMAMIPLVFLASIILLTEGVELAASLWRVERRTVLAAIPEDSPRVCIHVPCYNEPPEMVIATLDALARLDYDAFDVLLFDNNTPDPETWLPVQAHCQALGPRFRFVHMDGVKGFKAGALNEALKITDPEVKYIAVIDSDYQVEPSWLRRALPFFASPKVALVQGPQDYRDGQENLFKAMCFEEYRGFFQIGMVERNEHDAIIQHGTMMVVRKSALEEVNGWSTWCITEDTELGLKLFEAGYGAAYIPESMGRGLTPDTLAAFMSQRYRWVYGAMQIMKRHGGAIFLGRRGLTWAQRYQFLSGWLPWFSDGLGLAVTFFALIWTALMAAAPMYFDVPMAALSAAALTLFFAKTAKTLLLYPKKVGSGVIGAVIASTAGLALTHTVGKAVLAGLFTANKPFLRTPKCENPAALGQVLKLAWQESTLLGLLWLAAFSMLFNRGLDDPAAILWMIMLLIQSLPYFATVATAAISAMSYKAPPQVAALPQPQPEMPKAA